MCDDVQFNYVETGERYHQQHCWRCRQRPGLGGGGPATRTKEEHEEEGPQQRSVRPEGRGVASQSTSPLPVGIEGLGVGYLRINDEKRTANGHREQS